MRERLLAAEIPVVNDKSEAKNILFFLYYSIIRRIDTNKKVYFSLLEASLPVGSGYGGCKGTIVYLL